jgi:hypothetical protein
MKIEEAKSLIADAYPDYTIYKITDTSEYYLVAITPNVNAKQNKKNIGYVANAGFLKAVDKNTKEIFTYHPVLHERD